MTFDESYAHITEALTGRTIERVERAGKELHVCTACGHKVKLQADINGDIHFKGVGVSIALEGLDLFSQQGMQ